MLKQHSTPMAKNRNWVVLIFVGVISATVVVLQYELNLGRAMLDALNQDFSLAIISSFIGTAAAAGAIYYLGQAQKKRDLLSAINMSIALMASHTNTLLNFKVQILKPIQEEKNLLVMLMSHALEIVALNGNPEKPLRLPMPEVKTLCQMLVPPSLEFLVAIEKLSPFAERFPQAIVLAVKAKESMDNIKSLLKTWDDLVIEMRQSQIEGKELMKFFGLTPSATRAGSYFDTRVPNTIDNLVKEVDSALFFLRATTEELQDRSRSLLPDDVLKTLAKTRTKDGYEIHMPPRNLVAGWEEE